PVLALDRVAVPGHGPPGDPDGAGRQRRDVLDHCGAGHYRRARGIRSAVGPVTSTVVNSARTGALKTSFTSGMGAVTVESGSGTASSRLTCAHAGDAGTTSTSTIAIATYHIRLSHRSL